MQGFILLTHVSSRRFFLSQVGVLLSYTGCLSLSSSDFSGCRWQDGSAIATKGGTEVMKYTAGDYFGELARNPGNLGQGHQSDFLGETLVGLVRTRVLCFEKFLFATG